MTPKGLLLVTVRDKELWVDGLTDPGPFVRITGRCASCGAILHTRSLDVRKDNPRDDLDAAVREDASIAISHECEATHERNRTT